MSKLLKSKFLLGVVMLAAVFAVVGFANTSEAASCTIATTLKVGSVGAEVQCLQSLIGVSADGKFGPMTAAAVKAFQASKGLVADGVVGPMTRAALMGTTAPVASGCQAGWLFNPATGQACTGTPSTPSTPGNLEGGAGDITIDALSTYGDETIGEDEEDVKVLAFEIEADDESDVEITSVKVELNEQDSGDDEDMDAYMSSVSVFMGSDKVGEADAEDFSESGDHVFTKSISLDGAVVKAGETEKFYLAITALANLDSGDINSDDWQIGVSSIRFLDAEGVTTTESLTLDIDDNATDDTLEEEFDFGTFADSADVELKVALKDSDSDINEAHVINVESGSTDTDDVEVLSFTMEAEGSDITVTDLPVTFTTTGETDESVLLSAVHLLMDGEEIATESVPDNTGAVTFDDLDIEIAKDDKVDFTITVDLQDLTGALDEGDTVKAEVTSTNVDNIVAEDETGEDLAAADLTGSALGEASVAYDSGLMLTFVSSSEQVTSTADAAGESDTGEFKVTFKATAFDGDVRMDKSCEAAGADAAGQGTEYSTSISAADTTGWTLNCIMSSSSSDSEDTANTFEVDEDTTRTFTLTLSVTPDEDSFVEAAIASVNWGTATDDTNANYYTFNLDNFKTDSIFLNDM